MALHKQVGLCIGTCFLNRKRLYYNLFLAGDMGSGKSTILKKILRDNAAKGHYIRGFDKSGVL